MPLEFIDRLKSKLFKEKVIDSHKLTARLLIERDNEYLCLKQTDERGGKLTFPGGAIRKKESIKKGLLREIKEETNLSFKKKELKLIHIQYRRSSSNKEVVFFFKAKAKNLSDLILNEPDKFEKFSWIKREYNGQELAPVSKSAWKAIGKEKLFTDSKKKKKKVKSSIQNSEPVLPIPLASSISYENKHLKIHNLAFRSNGG